MADAAGPSLDTDRRSARPARSERVRAWLTDGSASGIAQRFAGLAYLFRIANAGIAFLTQILLARWIGAHEFGIYAYVWTWVLLLGTLSNLGLGTSPQRFIPTYLERGEMDMLRGFVDGGRWLAFGLSSLLAGVAALGLLQFSDHLQSWPLVPFYLGLACLPLVVLTEVQGGIARTYDWPQLAMAPTFLLRPLLLILVFAGMHVLGFEANAVGAMIAAIIATWITAAWQFLALGRRLKGALPAGPKVYAPKAWLRASFPQFMLEGFYLLLTYSDVILLERFVSPDQVAIYYAATKLVSLVAFVYFSVAAAAAHKFTHYHVADRPEELHAFMRASIRWTFLPSLAMSVAVLALGGPLLSLFGPGFAEGTVLLPVLLLGLLARASIGPVEKLLAMVGHQDVCALVYAIAFVVNIGLNLLLVPVSGLMGAAIATSIALVVESILLFLITRRRLGLHVFYWGGRRHRAS